jgi:anti-sigma regulatory factor (Ser/Thr protein kinase)
MTLREGQAPGYLRQEIFSRSADAESLCLKIRSTLRANDLGVACFAVELLARECLANAVNHGNRNDADRAIVLQLWVGRQWIRLRVSDQGAGFAWRKARRRGMDAAADSGRGLHLYALYAERVQFNRCGNQVTLWIRKKNRTRKGRMQHGQPKSC